MLDQIKIASPCSADWDRMEGTDRVRFCSECKKNVFNLSAMTRRDAEALIKETNGNICTRLYRRSDGTVMTSDCRATVRIKKARLQRRLGWAIAGALGLSTAFAQDQASLSGTVRKVDGTASARISVSIKGDQGNIETVTDEHGSFSAVLLAGKYQIKIGDSNVQPIDLRPGEALEMVIAASNNVIMGGPSSIRKPWYRRLF